MMRLTYRMILCLFFALFLGACNLASTPQTTPAAVVPGERLVVAWADAGNLMLWRQGEDHPRRVASGGVIRPLISPDGQFVAFTRGPAGAAESLWVVDVNGAAEQQLAAKGQPSTLSGEIQIAEMAWFDAHTLYFNTAQAGYGATPQNDLYRANVRTREVSLILVPGDGGRFRFSPDRKWIATVYPGTYQRRDGRIRVIDPLALNEPRDLLFFEGVSSGSEVPFFPEIHWLPDHSGLYAAIPDTDLLYQETGDTPAPDTILWRLPLERPSDREVIGQVNATLFGQPRWSESGAYLVYLQRTTQGQVTDLYLADFNGENPVKVATARFGQLALPEWIEGSEQFVYGAVSIGENWLGQPGEAPVLLRDVTLSPRFVSADRYVYGLYNAETSETELHYASIGGDSQRIAATGPILPLFDAVLGR